MTTEPDDQILAKAAESRAFVLQNMPELRPFIADLVKEGMIDGWRNVVICALIESGDAG